MAQDNKAISRQIVEEAFNKGNVDVLDEIVSQDIVFHDPGAPPNMAPGREGLKQMVLGYRIAYPDIKVTIEDEIVEGDKVVTRWSARGTNEGEMMGMPPTGKETQVTGITIDRIEGDQIVESWTNWDTLGLLQQLGVVPELTPAQT
jgi:steroid delta-isomerase-like uncharacterized protein